jgi:hypothetical protein
MVHSRGMPRPSGPGMLTAAVALQSAHAARRASRTGNAQDAAEGAGRALDGEAGLRDGGARIVGECRGGRERVRGIDGGSASSSSGGGAPTFPRAVCWQSPAAEPPGTSPAPDAPKQREQAMMRTRVGECSRPPSAPAAPATAPGRSVCGAISDPRCGGAVCPPAGCGHCCRQTRRAGWQLCRCGGI